MFGLVFQQRGKIQVAQKRMGWPVKAVLALCTVAFLGISVVPLLGNAFQSSGADPAVNPSGHGSDLSATRQQELEEQAKGFELVLQREPTNRTALESLIQIKLELSDIEGAIAPLKKLTELTPENPDYQVLLAQVQQQTGDREAAAQTYRTLLEGQPGNLKALQSLAALLMQENRPTAAVSLLQETLKRAPDANETQPGTIEVAAVKLMLGEIYTQQDRTEEAIALYDEVQAENAEDFRPLLAKAMVFKDQGRDPGEYEPLFKNAAALAPAQYKDQIDQLAKGPVTAPEGSDAAEAAAEATEETEETE